MADRPRLVLITDGTITEIPIVQVGLLFGAGLDDGDANPDSIWYICEACGYINYNVEKATDFAHDELCCQYADKCAWTTGELCITHTED